MLKERDYSPDRRYENNYRERRRSPEYRRSYVDYPQSPNRYRRNRNRSNEKSESDSETEWERTRRTTAFPLKRSTRTHTSGYHTDSSGAEETRHRSRSKTPPKVFKLQKRSSCWRDNARTKWRSPEDSQIPKSGKKLFIKEAPAPRIQLETPELEIGRGIFLIDSGAALNLITYKSLGKKALVTSRKRTEIIGLPEISVWTEGTTTLHLLGTPVHFYVVDRLPFHDVNGLLGSPYLLQERAEISFHYGTIVTYDQPIKPIKFYNHKDFKIFETPRKDGNVTGTKVCLPGRTTKQIAVKIANTTETEGYLPRIKSPKGIYIGEAAVYNHDGKCYVLATNTSEEDKEVIIPPQHIEPYDIFSSSEDEILYSQRTTPINTNERIRKIQETLNLKHLNSEEKKHALKIVKEFPDRFYLPGDGEIFQPIATSTQMEFPTLPPTTHHENIQQSDLISLQENAPIVRDKEIITIPPPLLETEEEEIDTTPTLMPMPIQAELALEPNVSRATDRRELKIPQLSFLDNLIPDLDQGPSNIKTQTGDDSYYEETDSEENTRESGCEIFSTPTTLSSGNGHYAHFISADCNMIQQTGKSLTDTGLINKEMLKRYNPKIGQILITPHEDSKIFSVVITNQFYEKPTKQQLTDALINLRSAIKQQGIKNIRMSTKGDGHDHLTTQEFQQLIKKVFRDTKIKITLCEGIRVKAS
ncbi:hypothetical protein KPH14_012601 [Odynerus spinipes]|uniref:Peptidase A2 domain-containing protein n=1 Tax=Odynerus spinipes TaxID=1348599 RepID=A0AAD9REL2_9HYME|nr:hypothetical protein KPH14_012601 [Odynerus spinipes]